MIGVRIKEEHKKLLRDVCKTRGEDVSDFVRRAILKELASLSFLPEMTKKALGLAYSSSLSKNKITRTNETAI